MNSTADAKEIFFAALDQQSPQALASYLDEACAANAELRDRVEQLLRAHAQAGQFLGGPAPAEATIDQPTAEKPGTPIGPYKLLQQIGEGGMGVVFMAEQHEPVQRRVALKIIKSGMDTRQVIARFEAERQALSLMDHPNIAKVLDAGTTDSGRPYFVMELVKGQPITQYCDEKHLTPRQRLELLLPVCQAIQHAHQKGIIHRDIKPTNILVAEYDQQPVPKVIDFGVAKATSQMLTEKTMFTGLGQIVGTLEYMSPEQAKVNQLDIDTRSDIYSLGVLLYELLTGSTPFDRKRLQSAAFDEMLRIIREEEPPKPSTRLSDSHDSLPSISAQRHTEPAKLARLVRGELDWIVMKALEKDRNRRYETANGFAIDVQRYLADEPVQACPPSTGYRLLKFARRNKRALVMASVICLACLFAVGTLGWMSADLATRRARTTDEVNQFLQRADSLYGDNKLPESVAEIQKARGVLEASSGDEELKQQVSQWLTDLDTATKLEGIRLELNAPEDRNRAIADNAQVFRDYGIDVEALPAEEVTARIGRSKIKIDLVLALGNWAGKLRLDPELQNAARWQRLVAISEGADPDPWRLRLVRASEAKDLSTLRELTKEADLARMRTRTLAFLGESIRAAGDTEGAVAFLRNAQRQHPGDFSINSNLARCVSELKPPALDEALAFTRAALAARPKSAGAHSALGYYLHKRDRTAEAIIELREAIRLKPNYVHAHNSLGNAFRDQKKLDEAIAEYSRAIAIDPNFVIAHNNLGLVLHDQKKLEEAIAAYRKAIDVDPKNSWAHNGLGTVLYAQGKLDEAIVAYRQAFKFDPKDSWAHNNLGLALYAQGKLDEAMAAYRKAIEVDPKHAAAHINLGYALYVKCLNDEAIAEYREAIRLEPDSALAHRDLGNVLRDQNKPDEAAVAYRKAIEVNPSDALAHNGLVAVLQSQNKLEDAAAYYRKAIEVKSKDAWPHYNLGIVLQRQDKLDEAAAAYRKANEFNPSDAIAHNALIAVLQRQNKLDEVAVAYRKAIEANPKDTLAHYGLVTVLQSQNKLDEAVAYYRRAIEINPNDPIVHDLFVNSLQRQNKLDEAVAYYRKAIEIDCKNAMAHCYLGRSLFHQKKPGEAVPYFRKAVEIDPKYADAYFCLGRAVTTTGQYQEAIMWYSKAIDVKPNDQGFWGARSSVYKRLGQLHQTIAHSSEIMRIAPASGYALAANHNRMEAYISLQKWDMAIADCTKLLCQNANEGMFNNDLAWLFVTCPDPKLRNPEWSLQLAKKAVHLAPSDGVYWQTLAWAEYRAGDWKAAVAAMEKVRELGGVGDSLELFVLAMAHWQLGNKVEARKWYDDAVQWMEKNQPNDEELRRFRSEAEELMGVAGVVERVPPSREKN